MEGLSHIGLKTTNVDRSERFYRELLGGEVVRRRDEPDRRIWIMVRGVRLEIAEVDPWPVMTEDQRRALPAISFLTTPAETDAIAKRLGEAGMPHRGPVLKATGSSVGVYFGDPDGNPLSLSCPEGYPPDGLERNIASSWAAAPFEWSETAATP